MRTWVPVLAAMFLTLGACGSDEATPVGDAPIDAPPPSEASCGERLDGVVDLLRSGLPTYDYEPAVSIADLTESHDLVLAGTIASLRRIDERRSESDPAGSWTHVEVGEPEVLRGDVDVVSTSFDIDSLWADGQGDDPLGEPVDGAGVRFVAFLHESSAAPGGHVVGVQGLAVACDRDDPVVAVIEPLPDGPTTLDELTDAVPGLDRPTADAAACNEPDQDVATEPDWRRYADYREWTRDGCAVRIDVLGDRPGPAHCGWETVRVIITGDPLGERYDDADDDVEYVRDPDNTMGLSGGLELDASLPATAADTGYRSSDEELWLDPTDDAWLYLVSDSGVERWPRADSLVCD